jgi:hypothetical protein
MAKLQTLPDHGYNFDVLPDRLWRSMWLEDHVKFMYPDKLLTKDASIDQVMEALPAWMNAAAREEIRTTFPHDTERSGIWWANLWQVLGTAGLESREAMMVATAMAATRGLTATTQNLIDKGAPLGVVARPAAGWKWMDGSQFKSKQALSVLELCVEAMRVSSTVTPFHPLARKSLDVVLAAGADPNLLGARALAHGICYGPIARMLVDHGLDPMLRVREAHMKTDPEPLICRLFDGELVLSLPARIKVLTAFLENGLGLEPEGPGQPSLIDYMSKTVWGVRQLDVVLSHTDRDALRDTMSRARGRIEKRAGRMNATDNAAFMRKLDVAMLEISTATAPVRSKSVRL